MRKILRNINKTVKRSIHNHFDNFVFIHINKTGGSSIEKALHLPFEHKTALEKIDEIGHHKWDNKFSFTVFRNPWDKVVSHYHYRVLTNQTSLGENPIDFNEWVLRTYGEQDPYYYDKPKMFMPQYDWVIDESNTILVDRILHFENLDDEFRGIQQLLNKRAVLPHVKKSNRGDYKDYYNKDSIQIINNWFRQDIEIFDYEF